MDFDFHLSGCCMKSSPNKDPAKPAPFSSEVLFRNRALATNARVTWGDFGKARYLLRLPNSSMAGNLLESDGKSMFLGWKYRKGCWVWEKFDEFSHLLVSLQNGILKEWCWGLHLRLVWWVFHRHGRWKWRRWSHIRGTGGQRRQWPGSHWCFPMYRCISGLPLRAFGGEGHEKATRIVLWKSSCVWNSCSYLLLATGRWWEILFVAEASWLVSDRDNPEHGKRREYQNIFRKCIKCQFSHASYINRIGSL